ncbi:hypothetical protein OJ998_19840 [Solirubrobacter taibaiensis]|nr:hypothetical protein [Solirubrobacter taibaiensis]
MTSTFEIDGATVRVPVPDGWDAAVVDGGLRVQRSVQPGLPIPTLELAVRAATDARNVLEDELAELVLRLTDFRILHVEPRPQRAENWPGGAPGTPFVLAGCRQGIYSLLTEVGLVGGDGARVVLALVMVLFEEAATAQEDVDAILAGVEVDWP